MHQGAPRIFPNSKFRLYASELAKFSKEEVEDAIEKKRLPELLKTPNPQPVGISSIKNSMPVQAAMTANGHKPLLRGTAFYNGLKKISAGQDSEVSDTVRYFLYRMLEHTGARNPITGTIDIGIVKEYLKQGRMFKIGGK